MSIALCSLHCFCLQVMKHAVYNKGWLTTVSYCYYYLLTEAVLIRSVASVCLYVCMSVYSALTFESFDLEGSFLACIFKGYRLSFTWRSSDQGLTGVKNRPAIPGFSENMTATAVTASPFPSFRGAAHRRRLRKPLQTEAGESWQLLSYTYIYIRTQCDVHNYINVHDGMVGWPRVMDLGWRSTAEHKGVSVYCVCVLSAFD